ncbi:MAG: AAA family ATPase [Lachnospiraceae bacterium]
MEKQILISISREYGSGGHYIAEKLSEELGVLLLDHNMLDQIAADRGMNLEKYKKYDESPKKPLGSRTVRGMSNSIEENLAQMQFDYIKEKADAGTSMIVVGRCTDYILKDNESLITIFILGDMKDKVCRIMEVRKVNEHEAKMAIARHDLTRKMYHNSFTDRKWGDSRNYDLCINSSKLGLDQTVEVLKNYISKRVGI